MIGGLEAIHSWNGGELVLNQQGVWPRFTLRRITGLRSLGELDDIREDAIGRRGEIARPSQRRGKTIAYEGEVKGRSLVELVEAIDLFEASFDPTEERRMDVSQPVGLVPARFFVARAQRADVPDELSSLEHKRSFVVALRLSDPRFFWPAEEGPFVTSDISSQEGLTLPAQLPWSIAAPGVAAATVTVTNPGRTDADPVLTVNGPVSNPELVNDTTGHLLALGPITLAATDELVVDFRSRTAKLNGEDQSWLVDHASSTWWDEGVVGLPPGDSTLRLRGDDLADPAQMSVTFHPADPA